MTDKKLTDNEIIKALECCITSDCHGCALGHHATGTYNEHCGNDLMKNALDLINRQKAEINRKEKVFIETLRRCALKDEIISEKTAEIERLKAENEELNQKYAWKHKEYMQYRKKHSLFKAEAYKECIEKVKEEIYSQPHSRSLEASVERARIIKIFDNLLKEMVGEDNA